MARVRISSEFIVAAMQTKAVREALKKRADRVQSRAEQLAASEDVDLTSQVSEGTRPKGRPYARVSSENVAQEWGTSNTERRRILGRAAGS